MNVPTAETPRSSLLWVPVIGIIYAAFAPVSDKYFFPFHHLNHVFDGRIASFFVPNGFRAGTLVFRLLLGTAFLFAIVIRSDRQQRWHAFAAGMYWPLLVSTVMLIGQSGYAIIWAWIFLPIHVIVAFVVCSAAARSARRADRFVALGILYGTILWLLSLWL